MTRHGLSRPGLTALVLVGLAVGMTRGAAAETPAREAAAAAFDILVAKSRAAAFPPFEGAWTLTMPQDHGGHDTARGESWSIVAHLAAADGRALGVQFSMVRLGLFPPSDPPDIAPTALYRAHVVVLDTDGAHALSEERLSRGLGAAGHDSATGEVWLDDWLFAYDPDGVLTLELGFRDVDLPIALTLTPEKPAAATDASENLRGYALPRLVSTGTIGPTEVTGTAFLSHLWGNVPVPGAAVSNDVLALALEDGSDLSLVRTTRRDGRGGAVLDGVIFGAPGETRSVSEASHEMAPDPDTTEAWTIRGPALDLTLTPLLSVRPEDFVFGFETGLMEVSGTRNGQPVSGLGTLQRSAAGE